MRRVLVIDDTEELRAVIAATLCHAGYAVRQADNGRNGILLALSQRPDLILCDVRMPEMDGYRTLAAIRGCHSTAAIPFILMTGSTDRDEFRRGMVCGADDYLMKPFTGRELLDAVKSRLERQADLQIQVFQTVGFQPFQGIAGSSAESVPVSVDFAVAG